MKNTKEITEGKVDKAGQCNCPVPNLYVGKNIGIKVGGQNINNLRYADDTVLIAENKEDLQKLLNIVDEESRKKGLELNSEKTEVMASVCIINNLCFEEGVVDPSNDFRGCVPAKSMTSWTPGDGCKSPSIPSGWNN
ncbi:catenin (cadherin-associated protein), alpha 3 [Plakobranchus ocellatus]|uniref:Catenin (Cadherin-associated protein), alpha 3 n=1 Tax=Plakobranchus ocellatus TaxID=259542 RepID=A0AAV4BBM1_9GAST|nr:catenin (cadherin-associated protein), alpha 3 [Plakobranchus ocellatus]